MKNINIIILRIHRYGGFQTRIVSNVASVVVAVMAYSNNFNNATSKIKITSKGNCMVCTTCSIGDLVHIISYYLLYAKKNISYQQLYVHNNRCYFKW